MTRQVIERDRLGALSKIGQGGQGVVYRAPNVTTKFAASMVYKEYKAGARAGIDFTALAAMPALVEESLTYAQAERLINIAAWPCRIVEYGGAPSGFVMPAIPDEFFISLTTVKGVSNSTAEFQHLLNHPSVLTARGIELDDAQRYSLLREVAYGLAFLHKHGVCVGDISPKNLLFSLSPRPAVYFIDCDAMRINTVSALPQVETPGWDVPPGEELATIYSDTYKLGLLALRLVTGDHDTKNPQHLPAAVPVLLRQIITDTLASQPQQRPLPEAWTYVLGHAIEEAQHQKRTASPAPVSAAPAPPPVPVVHSRPPVGRSAPPVPPPPRPAYLPPPPIGTERPPGPERQRQPALIAAVAGVAILFIVGAAVVIGHGLWRDSRPSQTQTALPATPSGPTAPPTMPLGPTVTPAPASTSTSTAQPAPYDGPSVMAVDFQSPSGSVMCTMGTRTAPSAINPFVACEVMILNLSPPPAVCHQSFVGMFDLEQGTTPDPPSLCTPDYSPVTPWSGYPILGYGQTHTVGAITCDNESSALTCTDTSTGHYFRVSGDSYQVG
jgi:serine/threonine protein kinase